MCRRTAAVGLALLWSIASLAMSSGCCGIGCCGGGRRIPLLGNAVDGQPGCDSHCDRYAPQVYHHNRCHTVRDPRIPGPRDINTLPAEPEMEAPNYFHPVPTYPVFGPRSEQPDGIDPQLQPLLPRDTIDGESLPAPMLRQSDAPDEQYEQFEQDDQSADSDMSDGVLSDSEPMDGPTLSSAGKVVGRAVSQTGWKPAKKQTARMESPTRPCPNCSVTFRRPSSIQR